uniref:Lipoprotein n=1 Tax=Strongyloides papillosus TaxID=174720 RepID=A0A0N5C5G4_STREA
MKTIYIIFFLSFFIACGSYGSTPAVIEKNGLVGKCKKLKCKYKCMQEHKLGECNFSGTEGNPETRKAECICIAIPSE